MLKYQAVADRPLHESPLPSQTRVAQAAHEFESQMLKELTRPLREGSLDASDSEDGDGIASGGAFADLASESLARAMSEGGGFGIAAKIEGELIPASNQNGKTPVTGHLHRNTS